MQPCRNWKLTALPGLLVPSSFPSLPGKSSVPRKFYACQAPRARVLRAPFAARHADGVRDNTSAQLRARGARRLP